ncbi:MAG: molybdenum cofactor guanylyltransferase [Chloroflexi bacterium]|nr:molybdenum cofactor guanylyltransferase [Chloroflexota bacterium]
MTATGIILAGGKNLRLGKIKALQTIGGKSLVERAIERLRPIVSQIFIVTSAERAGLLDAGEAKILTDLYPGHGPLGGIYTGLAAAQTSHGIVVACDMPFLNTKLLGHMLAIAADFDAVVPRVDGGMIEPLHAVYSRKCLDKMKARLDNKQLSVESFIKTLNVRYIDPEESQQFDPRLLSFFNINYQADLERAIALDAATNP